MTHAPAFSDWLDAFFASHYRRRPVDATFIGVHEHDTRLPDYSPDGVAAARTELDTLLVQLSGLPDEPLSEAEQIDRRLAEGALRVQQWEYTAPQFGAGNPSYYIGEAVFGTISLFLRPFAPFAERAASARERMRSVPVLLEQARATITSAPQAWTERAIRECDGAEAFFGDGIDLIIAEHGDAQGLRAAADIAAAGVAEYRAFLEHELLGRTNESYACGAEAFALLLEAGHCLDMSADAIERYAEEQIRACQDDLARGASAFGAASWQEALAQLADLHPSAERYYASYGEVWQSCRAAAEERELLTWPEFPISYVPQPNWARGAAPSLYFLFYRAPAAFDDVSPLEYLVTPIEPDMPAERQEALLRANNDSVIKLNHVVHHGAIGHHVQNWHARRAASRVGQVAAVDCASRIALLCGGTMAEGWACYATDLMAEQGFLTPLERFAERHSRLRQAARALVDVRLHHGRMTLDEASSFYHEQTGMAPTAAWAEAIKNSMFPGAAMMYLIGTDTIHSLRRELSGQPGFSLRSFHDQFLSYGSIPVTLIAQQMRAKGELHA